MPSRNDDVYALVAYILTMNDVIKDDNFELDEELHLDQDAKRIRIL